MGFYVRKSVKAGPFRFTMSKSGLGVSVGVPGFRVGSGPRGNYVSVGTGAVSYRSTLIPGAARPASPAPAQPLQVSQVLMEDVSGASAIDLALTGPGNVVAQLNDAAKRTGWFWPAFITAAVLGLLAMPYGLILWALAVPLLIWLRYLDGARRTVVAFYDVEGDAALWLDAFVDQWGWLSGSQKLWRTMQSGRVTTTRQHKTNAGASDLVQRVEATANLLAPKHLATNVAVPTIAAGKASIHFLPDRVIVRDGKHYSDIGYEQLSVHGATTRFIESRQGVPRDAERVGRTWQYVNVKGGPDRRYKNNPVLPIMQYGTLELRTPGGLAWLVQISRKQAGPAIANVLRVRPRT